MKDKNNFESVDFDEIAASVVEPSSVPANLPAIDQQRLTELENFNSKLFALNPDGLLLVELSNNLIVKINRAAIYLLGYPTSEIIQQPISKIIQADNWLQFLQQLEVVEKGGQFYQQISFRHYNSFNLQLSIRGSVVTWNGQQHLLLQLRDVSTESKFLQVVERYRSRKQRPTEQVENYPLLSRADNLRIILQLALSQIKRLVTFDYTLVYMLKTEQTVLGSTYEQADLKTLIPIPAAILADTTIQMIVQERRAVTIGDVWNSVSPNSALLRLADFLQIQGFGVMRSWLGVPVILEEQVVAIFSLSYAELDYFTERQVRLVNSIIQQAINAHQRLYTRTQNMAVQEERERMARELHDSVVQVFYSISLGVNTARAMLKRDLSQIDQQLNDILLLTEAGMTEMRSLIFELRPESLRMEGLVGALSKQAQVLRLRHNLEVEENLCAEPDIPLNLKETLYRLSQEATHNVIKHAHAQKVVLSFDCQPTKLILEISDDGRGFDPTQEYAGHLGLRSMNERVMQVGGRLEISSVPAGGTTIRAIIPIK